MSFWTIRLIRVSCALWARRAPWGQKRLLQIQKGNANRSELRIRESRAKMYAIIQNKSVNSTKREQMNVDADDKSTTAVAAAAADPTISCVRFFPTFSSFSFFQYFSVLRFFCSNCFCRAHSATTYGNCVRLIPPDCVPQALLFVRNSFGIWSSRVHCCRCCCARTTKKLRHLPRLVPCSFFSFEVFIYLVLFGLP